jgi:hypothetical protein
MLLRGATGSAICGGSRRHALGRILVIALIAAAAYLHPHGAGAQPQTDAQTLAKQAVRRLDLQTELRREDEPEPPLRLQLPPETIWVAVIIGVIILLYAFRDLIPVLRAGRSGEWTEDEAAGLAVGPRPPEIVLGAADDLAAQGRFVEAMHVLLLQALADIRRRLDEEFADSMTSREILRSRQLSDTLRRPLREVINRVEWTYFGGHPANRDDYLACRASFSALAQALVQALPRSAAA